MKRPEEKSEVGNRETIPPSRLESGQLISPSENSHSALRDWNSEDDTMLAQRPSGPRSPAGKKRSKYNATRHGIFSNVVVLEGESRGDYDVLLDGLLNSWKPVEVAEVILVEKMAMLLWRHRRLITAEGAEIQMNQAFVEWDRKQRQQLEAEEQVGKLSTSKGLPLLYDLEGLIWRAENPEILDRCLEWLRKLREEFEADGFCYGATQILEKVYGPDSREHLKETLLGEYEVWSSTADCTKKEREEEGYATPEECKENFLKAIDAEITRLRRYRKQLLEIEAHRTEVEKLRRSVPDSGSLDRLMRYETTLERAFDRALIQLERLQRMRLGQPVPPPLKVEISKN